MAGSKVQIGVAILGAGASKRMGRPKLLLRWGRTSVIGHLLWQWRNLDARQIALVSRPDDERLADELDRLRFPKRNRIVNPLPQRGMFSSIVCAAKWTGWEPTLAVWAIVLGDQPHLRTPSLRTLLAFQRKHPDDICQPSFGGHGQHPVLLPRRSWIALQSTTAPTLKDFLASTRVIECAIDDPRLTLDLDTPQDYTRLLRLTKK
ncbi:MAG TPA: nucleotidyltransferase family protein [Verrucomicrobiae bacterium]|nr:nucleotidyltransferase family protein [Verrucomicrobiae bacterium]